MPLGATETEILENCVQSDTRSVQWITGLTQDECQKIALSVLARRVSFVFETMSNETLQSISKGELDFPTECRTVLSRLNSVG